MFLRGDDGRIEILRSVGDHVVEERDEGIFCRACGACIARMHDRVEKNGQHSHTFFNPAGIVYQIRCFTKAPGCFLPDETFSSEFTWFPGYVWKVALCTVCSSHMGWNFVRGDEQSFFGLIDANIWVG